ncbi:hypothetical protein A2U01_0080669, partial [Trifolium medium]|nr:hypothetical protein [Trifolium medium]
MSTGGFFCSSCAANQPFHPSIQSQSRRHHRSS